MGLGDCFVGVVFYKLRRAETGLSLLRHVLMMNANVLQLSSLCPWISICIQYH